MKTARRWVLPLICFLFVLFLIGYNFVTKTSHTKMGLRTLKIQYYINKFMPLMQKVPKLSAGIRAAC
jgi:hypothetical protein